MVQTAETGRRGGRERILDATLELVLRQGFAATTVDQILAAAGLTKGAFFYHFESKDDLAGALLERWVADDEAMLRDFLGRAERLARDPLQQVLLLVGLLEEHFDRFSEAPPGCLVTAFLYETGTMDEKGFRLAARSFAAWRDAIAVKLRAAMETRKPRAEVDVEAVADMLTSTIEGGYSLSKAYRDPKAMVAQLRNYRTFLELLFGE